VTDIDQTHYTRAVTQLGDRKPVVAREAIYTDNNIKLVERGSRIDSSLFEHLTRHKLLRPLDENLDVEELVDHTVLIGVGEQLLSRDATLKLFEVREPLKYRMSNIVNRILLPAPIAFKLTVAREERPELFTHSLINLLITIYIAARAELTLDECVNCASAALFHDLGQLHIDPQLFQPGHQLNDAERRHLYAHPVIGYLLLKPFSEYPTEVARAVYEHHERLDGSGYPRGLQTDQMSLAGRILAVAEIVSSRFDAEGHCQACHQLDFILKMNTRKLEPELVALLTPLLSVINDQESGQPQNEASVGQVSACLSKLLALVEQWQSLSERLAGASPNTVEGYINKQLEALSTTLSYAGLNLASLQELLQQCSDDPQILQEFLSALQEVRWQLKGLWNELARRWPEQVNGIKDGELKAWLEQLRSV
jgi:HD-GYP domain-containing protein (c-di-GMP phosphodiesterase class II)